LRPRPDFFVVVLDCGLFVESPRALRFRELDGEELATWNTGPLESEAAGFIGQNATISMRVR
jgi:hypothetical protein